MRLTRLVRSALAAAGLAAIVAVPAAARAETPLGVEFGKSKLTSSIDTQGGQPDEDVYVAPLLAGERLTVVLARAKKSTLEPELSLVRPDGTVVSGAAIGVKANKKGTKLKLAKFTVPTAGVWGVRVTGGTTTGGYSLSTKIAPAPALKLKKQGLDAAGQATRDHPFGGLDNGLLTFKLVFDKKASPVGIEAITDPDDGDVPGALAAVQAKGANRLLLKKHPLATGVGDYVLRTTVDAGTATYSLKLSVLPQGRPNTGKKPVEVSPVEPVLDVLGGPLRGLGGSRVRVLGSGFSTDIAPTVWFGTARGTSVAVSDGGTFFDVTAPAGDEGTTVSLTVQNPDGQATRRADYFLYPPPPAITDLRAATGGARRGGATAGGETLHLIGADFSPPVVVRFGTSVAGIVSVSPDGAVAEVLTPSAAPSTVDISLTDTFGRQAVAAFTFTYKVPPSFAAMPFDPPFAAAAGGTPVTLSGTAFQPDDTFDIAGLAVPVTFVNSTTLTFTSPAVGAGSFTTRLVDRYGTPVFGPSFVVEAPPTITSVVASSGVWAAPNEVPLSGGTTLRVTGAGMRASNTVTLAGVPVTQLSPTATTFDFVAAASASYGPRTLVVTDLVGQAATLDAAIRYVGFDENTAARAPAGTAVDDFGAHRGALGDLDGDNNVDDLVLGSYDDYDYPPGTRDELTRVMIGNGTALVDGTTARMPAAFTDVTGADPWYCDAVALGDVDGTNGIDIVTVGGFSYDDDFYNDIRVFTNDGSGTFAFAGALSMQYAGQYVPVYDTFYNGYYPLFVSQPPYLGYGTSTDVVLGDLDGDNDLDAVAGSTAYRAGGLWVPLNFVTLTPGAYTSYYYAGYYYNNVSPTYQYAPALSLFVNVSPTVGFVDASFPRLPQPGSAPSTNAAFPATDVALGDIDGDNDLDIVCTWPDPLTTTPYGIFTAAGYGSSYDSARLATSVLTNNGSGWFTDASSTWMPAVSTPEFWQAHQVALADFDGDTDLDMALLHGVSIDAHTAGGPTFTSRALRILRNDGAATGFTDVSSSALPSVPLAGTADDNLRGRKLLVRDVNGDGLLDILIGTPEPLEDSSSDPVRSTRLLLGRSGLTFAIGNAFLPPASDETGEAQDLLLGDLDGNGQPSLLLLSEIYPVNSVSGEYLRVFDWRR